MVKPLYGNRPTPEGVDAFQQAAVLNQAYCVMVVQKILCFYLKYMPSSALMSVSF